MADWFESRFREPVDAGQVDPAFAARLRAMVVEEWQADAGSTPSHHIDPDDHEGDLIMLETDDRPTGHEPPIPGRPSPGRWLLVAAMVGVVAVVGALLVAVAGDDDEDQVPATSTPTTEAVQNIFEVGAGSLEPGRYSIDPDGDDTTPLRVTVDVEAEGWEPFIPVVKSAFGHTAVTITTVPNVVTDGCRDHTPLDPPVGPTVDDLATALSQLAPFEVTAAPTDVTVFGYSGKHLALRVPPDLPENDAENFHDFPDCVDGELHSWIATNNDGSFYGYEAPGHTEEFWILDVQGTRLVLIKDASPGTPAQDLAERDAIFDTIRIEP
jgi:hypothetical protein